MQLLCLVSWPRALPLSPPAVTFLSLCGSLCVTLQSLCLSLELLPSIPWFSVSSCSLCHLLFSASELFCLSLCLPLLSFSQSLAKVPFLSEVIVIFLSLTFSRFLFSVSQCEAVPLIFSVSVSLLVCVPFPHLRFLSNVLPPRLPRALFSANCNYKCVC